MSKYLETLVRIQLATSLIASGRDTICQRVPRVNDERLCHRNNIKCTTCPFNYQEVRFSELLLSGQS